MGDRKVKQQYKAGKENYQKEVKVKMDKASSFLQDGKERKFAVATWTVYNSLCIEQDRKSIDKLVKDRIDKKTTRVIKGMYQYKRYLNTYPHGSQSHRFKGKQHVKYWVEIYNLMREALALRYAGGKTTMLEEDMQEGLDEGGDEMPSDLEETDLDISALGVDE